MTSVKLTVDVPNIASIKIIGSEKLQSLVVCDKEAYSIKVKWSNKTSSIIYRTYGMLFELQKLVGPIETNGDFTFLPGFSDFSKITSTEMRMYVIEQFLQDLLKNCPFTSHFLSFFSFRPCDMKMGKTEFQKKSSKPTWLKRAMSFMKKKKPNSELYCAEDKDDKVCCSYKVIKRFTSKNKHELTVYESTECEVVEKTVQGWWLVQMNARIGWVPAAVLDPSTGEIEETKLSSQCPDGRLCVTLSNYKAKNEDELSLEFGSTVELITAYSDGWWLVWFQGDLGVIPACYLMEIEVGWMPPDYSTFPMKHKPFRYCGLPPLPGEKYKPKVPPRRHSLPPIAQPIVSLESTMDELLQMRDPFPIYLDESVNNKPTNNKISIYLDENSNETAAVKSKISLTHSNLLGASKNADKELRTELFTPEFNNRSAEVSPSPFSSTKAVHGSSSTIPFDITHLSLASDLDYEAFDGNNESSLDVKPTKTAKELIEAFGALELAAAQIKRGFQNSLYPKISEHNNMSIQCQLTPEQMYMKGEYPFQSKTEKNLVSGICFASNDGVMPENHSNPLKFCNLSLRNVSTPMTSLNDSPFAATSALNKNITNDHICMTPYTTKEFVHDFGFKFSHDREGPLHHSDSDSSLELDPLNVMKSCTIFPVPKSIPRIQVTSPEGNVRNITAAPKLKKWQKTPSPAKTNPRDRLRQSLKEQLTAARLKKSADRHAARYNIYNKHRNHGPYTKLIILLSDFESGISRKLDAISVPAF